jgi:type VI secretion system protein ImpA
MPSPDLLDFAALTAPIPGDDPAGNTGDFYNVRRLLDEARTAHDPAQFQKGSPEREQEKRDPNWNKIIQEAKSNLASKCKHLVYAVRMAEAMVMQNGFAGVRDSMKLLRMMFTDCWDRVYPKVEEPGDEAARVAQINWLGDPISGALYPTKIRKTPLMGAMSWQNWKDASGDFEAAVAAVPVEKVQLLVEDMEAALQELRELLTACEQRVPGESAELGEVSRALDDCLNLAKQALAKKGGVPGAAAGADGTAASADGAVAGGVEIASVDPTAQRNAIYEQINQLADKLERIDSHSPVPWLLRKITKLGPMRFHKLVKLLTSNDNVLEFMKPEDEKDD